MREVIHTDYEGRPLKPTAIDDCILDNLRAPVVRSGAEGLTAVIAETMSDWGLAPTVREDVNV